MRSHRTVAVAGLPYAEMETRGVLLPVVEAHVEYHGRARYDDLLRMTSRGALVGKARCAWTARLSRPPPAIP